MGQSQSNTNPCGKRYSSQEYANCMERRAADYDWNIEKQSIESIYDNFPKMYEASLSEAYSKARAENLKEYEKELQKQLDETKKTYEEQFQETAKSYQDALNDFATKGKQTCDDIKNSPEYKQKQQEIVDLKNKQADAGKAIQQMNFENVHRDEINKALKKIVPGASGCDNTVEEMEQKRVREDIEEEEADDADEIDEADGDREGGNIPEVVYEINRRYIMHNQDDSPLKKMDKKYRKK
jgi:hypothetical protein